MLLQSGEHQGNLSSRLRDHKRWCLEPYPTPASLLFAVHVHPISLTGWLQQQSVASAEPYLTLPRAGQMDCSLFYCFPRKEDHTHVKCASEKSTPSSSPTLCPSVPHYLQFMCTPPHSQIAQTREATQEVAQCSKRLANNNHVFSFPQIAVVTRGH